MRTDTSAITGLDRAGKEQMLARAKLFAEVARRTESPFDALPVSDASAALIVLWQEATFWALSALGGGSSHRNLRAAFEAAPRDVVVQAAGGKDWLPSVEQALLLDARDVHVDEDSSGSRPETATLAKFARSLISYLETPTRELDRKRVRRSSIWLVAVLASLGALAGFGLSRRYNLPNRISAAKRSTSSEYSPCRAAGDCGNALFHTQEEDQPWVLYDLGTVLELHSIEVQNRTDCCYDRAVPLVVETSNDGESWIEQTRTERAFTTWSADLRVRARFIRLRADRRTYLHLGAVVVR
jgi:F5/8 type C domain-containing protein